MVDTNDEGESRAEAGTQFLAEQFQAHRAHLRAVAYRILGSPDEADDAVQEVWLRLSRSDTGAVENLAGWLTTVVTRVSLNMLQARATRREAPFDASLSEDRQAAIAAGPEDAVVMADSVGLALLVVLEMLTPAERLAFVLHDLFAMPFEEIAPIVGKSPVATRQLASRARRRVQGADPIVGRDVARQRQVVAAFLAASREGDFSALLALLDPEVVLRADAATVAQGAATEVHGAQDVAETFAGRAQAARLAVVDGRPGAVWSVGGTPRVVFDFTVREGVVTAIDLIADPETIASLDITLLKG
jgi:RNA polymerase sigma factor (sigma-70 family)